MASGESGLLLSPGGGMRSSSPAEMRRISSLSPLLPATRILPESPPASAAARDRAATRPPACPARDTGSNARRTAARCRGQSRSRPARPRAAAPVPGSTIATSARASHFQPVLARRFMSVRRQPTTGPRGRKHPSTPTNRIAKLGPARQSSAHVQRVESWKKPASSPAKPETAPRPATSRACPASARRAIARRNRAPPADRPAGAPAPARWRCAPDVRPAARSVA